MSQGARDTCLVFLSAANPTFSGHIKNKSETPDRSMTLSQPHLGQIHSYHHPPLPDHALSLLFLCHVITDSLATQREVLPCLCMKMSWFLVCDPLWIKDQKGLGGLGVGTGPPGRTSGSLGQEKRR